MLLVLTVTVDSCSIIHTYFIKKPWLSARSDAKRKVAQQLAEPDIKVMFVANMFGLPYNPLNPLHLFVEKLFYFGIVFA